MSTQADTIAAPPLVSGDIDFRKLDDDINRPLESFPTKRWWFAFSVASSLVLLFLVSFAVTVIRGIGTWGNNNPVGWGWAITNFVFWIGIGHAGTLISAILFLLRQRWRTGIARFAEAMTVFAVICALQFPLIHTGRPWLAFWMVPLPNPHSLWVNFRSPLLWDVFAVSTYGLVSFLFWYTGLIPDLASVRDRAKHRVRKLAYGLASLGWTGSNRAWSHYEKAYLLFAGLSTPLVLSVHSVVSFDFATSVLPGWHTTIFPPYFVAGAILSGFAMVATLIVVLRQSFRLQHIVTEQHLDVMNKIVITTSLMVGYAYLIEFFISWYSGNAYEQFVFMGRALGPYAWAYWTMVACNVVIPQLLWFPKFRRTIYLLYPIVLLVNVGMWFERFVIIVTSLHRDFLPSSWDSFTPTWVDVGLFVGSIGIFLSLVLLFCRFLPTISIAETKGILPRAHTHRRVSCTRTEVVMSERKKQIGLVGLFDDPTSLVKAARTVRDAGFKSWDCHTPYPVHGLDGAMGVKPSLIPIICLGAGFVGIAAALAMQGWMSAIDYPVRIGGKPLFSWPAFIPIVFELFVLFAAVATMGGVLFYCRLGRWHSPLHDSDLMHHVTSNRFALVLEAKDEKYSEEGATRLLEEVGCSDIHPLLEEVEDGEEES